MGKLVCEKIGLWTSWSVGQLVGNPCLDTNYDSPFDWPYQTHMKKYLHVLLRLFSGLEILVKHCSIYDKCNYHRIGISDL